MSAPVARMRGASIHLDMPLIWRPIPGFDGLYSASNTGLVRSEARLSTYKGSALRRVAERIVKAHTDGKGYPRVHLWRDGARHSEAVHRLVLLAFRGPPPMQGMEGAHNDGDRSNSHLNNLRWSTCADNQADRITHGTSNRGERHGQSKLTSEQVLAIRADTRTQSQIAENYGVLPQTISRLKLRIDWGWLP